MRVLDYGFWLVTAAVSLSGGCVAAPEASEGSEAERARDEALTDEAKPLECAGFLGLDCPAGYRCTDVPDDGCDPHAGGADCPGVCEYVPPFSCAGFLGIACPGSTKTSCVDDWRDDCDPLRGGADCPGLCLPSEAQGCGATHDPPCPAGTTCVADPTLACAQPDDGVAECSTGLCVLAECNPLMKCLDVLSCVDGLVYPTSCGPANCDAAIGPCKD